MIAKLPEFTEQDCAFFWVFILSIFLQQRSPFGRQ
ncbi:hypothetical protein SLEP1_g22615 [Rubroshorea leprosula]|uniref:Uncharacterized protein n=1 Tax=Rubroshorea leprosula TaxID=152421 RepID=A0AAV5JK69_9ROSI|nr:hypothetical protein SLEP1_g22615 [Rubroshorea leprosula]